MRETATMISVTEGEANVVALDSSNADVNEGESDAHYQGRLHCQDLHSHQALTILINHHHILAVPGTGRDVNNLRDAGDVMAILRELKVDMVLSGHRHVPYVWSISGVRIVHSGTASSMRVRGVMPPSYNVIEFDEEKVNIWLREPGKGESKPLASFSRSPVTTSQFYPAFDNFVTYDKLPFLKDR